MRFSLRSLLILLALGPPLLGLVWHFLPSGLLLAAAIYFGTAALAFAAWWLTICRRAAETRERALQNEITWSARRNGD